MASPCEQRIEVSESIPDEEKSEISTESQVAETQSTPADEREKTENDEGREALIGTEDASMELSERTEQCELSTIERKACGVKSPHEGMEENAGDDVEKLIGQGLDKGGNDNEVEDNIAKKESFNFKEPSLLSMVTGSGGNGDIKTTECEDVEFLSLGEGSKQEIENIDESESVLIDGNGACGLNVSVSKEENMDTSESFPSEKLQQPQHFGEKEVSASDTNSRNDADSELELDMKRASTIHLPESVYNIDEETRMGLDQTPSENSMASSMITPLPPKKLFHLDDTKDSVDSETKLSATTDTEDIRLRNTISVDQENTKDSVASDSGPTPSKRIKGYREGLGDVIGESKYFTAEHLFEYQWPQDGGDWHMLQEHISEFLKVKSFKRKYPDLYRRVCDKEEKDFLREKGVVSETQSDLGLTALRSEEVYDLMMKDYNDRYQEYLTVLQEKQKRVMREKHKEYGVAKLDKSKMEAYSKKAARWAAEFNASLMREKREERQAYFDLQTYTIHHTKNKFRTLPPAKTKIGSYPVALITGQYQDNFKHYHPDELCNFPLKTALTDPPPRVKYLLKPPASLMEPVEAPAVEIPDVEVKAVGTDDLEGPEEDRDKENVVANDQEAMEVSNQSVELEPVDATFKFDKRGKLVNAKKLAKGKLSVTPDKGGRKYNGGKKKEDASNDDNGSVDGEKSVPKQIHGLEKCRICKQRSSKEDRMKDRLIRCAQCLKIGHMSCLDLTDELVAVIKTYPWQCMECKACVQCMDPYDEDKMMFCDRCDRGYHTFCIGLEALPTGHWECRSCVNRKPDEAPEGETREEEINSHNVIKDENQDSQDSIKDSGKGGKWVGKDILDTKPIPENELTTEYLMKLAGRNANWRKDTGSDELEPEPSPNPIQVTTPTSTPLVVVKKERSAMKRKKLEMSLNPTRSRPDRAHGARQSKRIKAREEEEEKKDDGDEKTKEDNKEKKKLKGVEMKESEDKNVNVKNEGKEEEEGEDVNNDKVSDEVVEGVDDSEVMAFEKNEEEVALSKEEEDEWDESSEEDKTNAEEKESLEETEENFDMKEGVEKEGGENNITDDNGEGKASEILEEEKIEETFVQNVDENETASATDKLLELIDTPNDGMEQETLLLAAGGDREHEGTSLQSANLVQEDEIIDEDAPMAKPEAEKDQIMSSHGDEENESIMDQGNEKDVALSDVITDTAAEASSLPATDSESQQNPPSCAEESSELSPLIAMTTEEQISISNETVLPDPKSEPLWSTRKPASPSTSSSLSSSSSSSSSIATSTSSASSSSSHEATAATITATTTVNSSTTPSEPKTDAVDANNSSSLPAAPNEILLPTSSYIPISSIPLPPTPCPTQRPTPIPALPTSVSDIPLPQLPSPLPTSTQAESETLSSSQPTPDLDPSTIPLPMDTH